MGKPLASGENMPTSNSKVCLLSYLHVVCPVSWLTNLSHWLAYIKESPGFVQSWRTSGELCGLSKLWVVSKYLETEGWLLGKLKCLMSCSLFLHVLSTHDVTHVC